MFKTTYIFYRLKRNIQPLFLSPLIKKHFIYKINKSKRYSTVVKVSVPMRLQKEPINTFFKEANPAFIFFDSITDEDSLLRDLEKIAECLQDEEDTNNKKEIFFLEKFGVDVSTKSNQEIIDEIYNHYTISSKIIQTGIHNLVYKELFYRKLIAWIALGETRIRY